MDVLIFFVNYSSQPNRSSPIKRQFSSHSLCAEYTKTAQIPVFRQLPFSAPSETAFYSFIQSFYSNIHFTNPSNRQSPPLLCLILQIISCKKPNTRRCWAFGVQISAFFQKVICPKRILSMIASGNTTVTFGFFLFYPKFPHGKIEIGQKKRNGKRDNRHEIFLPR